MAQPNIEFMLEYILEYLNGTLERWAFDLGFSHHLGKRRGKMRRENRAFAECFNTYVVELGFDLAKGLSDAEHKKLLRRQYRRLRAAAGGEF
jgi:hypothetical protein